MPKKFESGIQTPAWNTRHEIRFAVKTVVSTIEDRAAKLIVIYSSRAPAHRIARVNQARPSPRGIMHENESGFRRAPGAKPRCTVKLIKLLELARGRRHRRRDVYRGGEKKNRKNMKFSPGAQRVARKKTGGPQCAPIFIRNPELLVSSGPQLSSFLAGRSEFFGA